MLKVFNACMRCDTLEKTTTLPKRGPGRPKLPDDLRGHKGKGKALIIRIEKKKNPNIQAMLECKTPYELEQKYGIKVDPDLEWSKAYSVRATAILETLARRRVESEDQTSH